MIDSSQISVVVQGPVSSLTRRCLLSVRKYLPKAEVILSTWENSNVEGLSFDKVVFSKDPGGVLLGEYKRKKYYDNTNRQIISTREGLVHATHPFCVKFRSDMMFTSTGFLRYYNRYPKKSSLLNLFENRVIVCDSFTPNPDRLVPKSFSPSDWFNFGLTSDVKKLWDIPLEPKEYSTWFIHHPYPPTAPEKDVMRYRCEQYIWLSCLRKYTDIPCEHQWDYGEHNRELHELSFANNFIILSAKEVGVKFMKYGIGMNGWVAFYTHHEWQKLYKKYCDPEFSLSQDWQTNAKNLAARILKSKLPMQQAVNWYDYRYNQITAAWNNPARWKALRDLFSR